MVYSHLCNTATHYSGRYKVTDKRLSVEYHRVQMWRPPAGVCKSHTETHSDPRNIRQKLPPQKQLFCLRCEYFDHHTEGFLPWLCPVKCHMTGWRHLYNHIQRKTCIIFSQESYLLYFFKLFCPENIKVQSKDISHESQGHHPFALGVVWSSGWFSAYTVLTSPHLLCFLWVK